jgi:hypothetical protein
MSVREAMYIVYFTIAIPAVAVDVGRLFKEKSVVILRLSNPKIEHFWIVPRNATQQLVQPDASLRSVPAVAPVKSSVPCNWKHKTRPKSALQKPISYDKSRQGLPEGSEKD